MIRVSTKKSGLACRALVPAQSSLLSFDRSHVSGHSVGSSVGPSSSLRLDRLFRWFARGGNMWQHSFVVSPCLPIISSRVHGYFSVPILSIFSLGGASRALAQTSLSRGAPLGSAKLTRESRVLCGTFPLRIGPPLLFDFRSPSLQPGVVCALRDVSPSRSFIWRGVGGGDTPQSSCAEMCKTR